MVKSIVNTVGTKFLSAAFNFFIILITANYLGTEGRGQISLLIASITIVLLFANFVGGNTLIFLTPRKPISELLFVSYLWTLLTVILAFLSMYFFHVFDFNYCLHISLLSLLFSFTAIHISILLGKENIETANKITLFQVIAHFFLLGICFIFFEMNTDSVFIFSLYVTYGIAFLLSAFYLKNFIDKSVTFKLSDTLRMAFTIGALAQTANIFQFLNYRLDIYLLHNYDSLSNRVSLIVSSRF